MMPKKATKSPFAGQQSNPDCIAQMPVFPPRDCKEASTEAAELLRMAQTAGQVSDTRQIQRGRATTVEGPSDPQRIECASRQELRHSGVSSGARGSEQGKGL